MGTIMYCLIAIAVLAWSTWYTVRSVRNVDAILKGKTERPYPWPEPNCARCDAYLRGYQDGYSQASGDFGALVDDDWD